MRKTLLWKSVVSGSLAAAVLGLTACGSSGAGGGGGPVPVAVDKCAPAAGAADAVQAQLAALSSAAAGVPEAGPAAADLVSASIAMTDAVDAIAGAVQSIATTQDPSAVAAEAQRVGDRISCGLDDIAAALETLNATALAGTPVQSVVSQALTQIDTIQALLGSSVPVGGSDLGTVTDPLEVLALQLMLIVGQIPVDDTGLPETRLAMAAVQGNIVYLVVLLNEVGQLDAAGTAAALTNYYTQLGILFSTAAQLDAGPVSPIVAQVAAQVQDAAGDVVPVLQEGLVMLLDPIFSAVRTVLGGPSLAPAYFQQMLMGLIAANPVSGQLAALVNALGGGGSLDDLLAGVPVLSDLVQEILASSGDPADVMEDVLHGVPGMPTLAEVIGQLPGLGGLTPPSTADIEALVQELLSLNGSGIPVISDVLTQVGGQFTVANLGDVTDALNDLLDGLLGGVL